MTTILAGPQEPLLATVKRRKLAWFGHVTRHDFLRKTVGQVKRVNINSVDELPSAAHNRPDCRSNFVWSSLISPQRLNRSRN
ncbi:hypothetical protein DPMN_095287 [Dreissena polymorpha]|uniref:Uncharacterized protein n=1 Tax=Dreissena polymorpha TaxID=45954 RepID=A0A9D4L7M4_DREPO|nr:hypothetical protein DPMN_095287 [Dreissena polymorpha]